MYPDVGLSALTPIIGSGFSDIMCSSKSISKSFTESEKTTLNFFGCSKNLYDSETIFNLFTWAAQHMILSKQKLKSINVNN